jgi:hypothetical protein
MITSPKSGDVWVTGSAQHIMWTPAHTPCGIADLGCDAQPAEDLDTVTITMRPVPKACLESVLPCAQPDLAPYTITSSAPNNGQFDWTIPTTLKSTFTGDEQITVTQNMDGRRGVSSVFSISGKGDSTDCAEDLAIVAPNGGETLIRKNTFEVKWCPGSLKGLVNIYVSNYVPPGQGRATTQYQLANQTPNDGSFNWTVGRAKTGDIPNDQYILTITGAGGVSSSSDAPFTVSDAASTVDSGVEGTITIGPACPGAIGKDGCPDKPYQTTIVVKNQAGAVLSRFSSDANGVFRADLAPGSYILASGSGSKLPSLGEQAVVVKPHSYTHIDLVFDSGIR